MPSTKRESVAFRLARRLGRGPAFTLAIVGYTVAAHHGLGPPPDPAAIRWYEPSAFLHHMALLTGAFESSARAFAAFTSPAALLAAGVFATTRSALARATALVCVASTLLFVFYGVVAPYPWEFFGWRGSAAIVSTAACVGCAVASPLLAASWLRLPRWLRGATYLPVAFGIVAVIRNATGTDESLKYSISPWPAVPVFGIEVGALFATAAYAGIAIAAAGFAMAESRGGDARAGARIAALLLGLAVPVGLVALGAQLSLLPFALGAKTLGGVAVLCAASIAAVVVASGRDAAALAQNSHAIAVGVALVGIPLLLGEVLARVDYHITREVRARAIIEALDRYERSESLYPDALEDLVTAGEIEAVPVPAIGFRSLHASEFRYQSFGSSFILEFEAPRWVECAYTPPFEEEEGEASEAPLGEAWSCPSEPPELW